MGVEGVLRHPPVPVAELCALVSAWGPSERSERGRPRNYEGSPRTTRILGFPRISRFSYYFIRISLGFVLGFY